MKIVIAGAGIGGLSTALRLHGHGIDCEIHEQSGRLRQLGVGINLLPHAVREFAELGLLERLVEAGIETRELFYTHRLGHEILRKPCGIDAGFALPQISLHRGRLQGVLLRAVRERLGAHAVKPGHRLTGFDQDSGGVTVSFADAGGSALPPVRGDVLVGADGIHSTVRSILFPREGPPRWNGVTMWRGATEWPAFGTGGSMLIAGGTSAKLVAYPIGRGRRPDSRLTNWAICVLTGKDGEQPPLRQDWSRLADRAELWRHLGTFRTSLIDHAALVAATAECFELPMCDRDPLPYWTSGRGTLLGDAAHPMYPMGSNGAGQAILDATALGARLALHADPAEALLAYQEARLPVTGEVVLRNRLGGPERVIDEVERRAPEGFTHIGDVMTADEIDAVVSGYATATGGARDQVNRDAG
ncbi:salicylate 1-monooxygenase [Prauserella marina]|uniref:2-polyprenyl-6-methoxyphenol hydroxylase n=1 Tax=Prauserella marina TaxID=530584 RepID=A0A222VNM7_9PSEU|nr:flavin-dependent oxidoreductase [Prauserella marina]ASR35525.1 salicylate 1-monooxygenase [Prauserella marina]PWV84638.1 2-polyprenyl-6-methoxyphenol hydroxylase-like FAD-dependent oxidoreductase [Prauserella marina]SDC17009.1 2-polyprenyl-6-methoxyphenol hydroxylase [Prauserella marina]